MTDPLDANSYVSGKQSDEARKVGKVRDGGALGRVATGTGSKGLQAASSAIDKYHKGGKVRKTGLARLKKGERVLTKGQQKRLLKKSKNGRAGKSKRGGKSR